MCGEWMTSGWMVLANELFYKVQGGETCLPGQYITGNIPTIADAKIWRILLIGLLLFLLAWRISQVVQRRLRRHVITRRRANTWNLVIFLGFFLVWETAISFPYFASSKMFIPDPITFWKANPKLLRQAKASHIGIVGVDRERKTGIFDKDYSTDKGANTYRLAFMGDSQSISYKHMMYAKDISYPKKMEQNLWAEGGKGPKGESLQVVNGGMSGYSSWQGIFLLKTDVIPLKPDLLVEAFGYHDSNDAVCYDKEVITDNPVVWNIRKLMYSSNICLTIRTISLRWQAWRNDTGRNADDEVHPRVPLKDFEENLRTMVSLGKQHGFAVAFFLEPTRDDSVRERMEPYHDVARKLGAEYKLPVIDAVTVFHKQAPTMQKANDLFTDSIHFTPQGHELAAQTVEDTLRKAGLITGGVRLREGE